jgi:hypothetical protein
MASMTVAGQAGPEGMAMWSVMEYEEATNLYRKKMTDSDRLFRLAPPMPSPVLSHRDDETWFLRDRDGRLIARVSPSGVRLA